MKTLEEEGIKLQPYGDDRDDLIDDLPDLEQVKHWVYDSVCEATDGCIVEPDGFCEHGHDSWLRRLGLL